MTAPTQPKLRSLLRQVVRGPAHMYAKARGRLTRRRVSRSKQRQSDDYNDRPVITAVVQFFNKRENAAQIVANLVASGIEEIIVIDDGSKDGSYALWPRLLRRQNDFLLRCNDIYEVRTYDRAIRMALGKYVAFLQDDDLPPADGKWASDAIALFERHPQLVILGGREALEILPAEPSDAQIKYPTSESPVYSYPGLHKYRIVHRPRYLDPFTGLPFEFADAVNRAPLFVRKREFIDAGGIPMEYAPIMCDDAAACLRAWRQGQRVGLYESRFTRNVSPGGMREFNQEFGRSMAGKNWRRLYTDFANEIGHGEIRQAVQSICEERLIPRPRDNCHPELA